MTDDQYDDHHDADYDDIWDDPEPSYDDPRERLDPAVEERSTDSDAPRRRSGPPPRRGRRTGEVERVRRPGDTGSVPVHRTDPEEDFEEQRPARGAFAGPPLDDEHDDYVDLPPDKLPKWVLVLGVLVLIAGVIIGGGMFWYQRQVDPPGPPGEAVEITIPSGASASGLGNRLAGEGVVTNGMLFNFWAGRNDIGVVKAGVYEFKKNMSFHEARSVLQAGPSREGSTTSEVMKVLIPEGLTLDQIEGRIHKAVPRFTVAEIKKTLESGQVTSKLLPKGSKDWEGLLFPATYEVDSKTTVEEFLTTLSSTMERRVDALDPAAALKKINSRYGLELTEYDLMKVASLVQAEAGGAEEAPKIASVIYNRLAKKSTAYTLGIDAADEYGAELEGMTPAEYRKTDGPYNLRKIAGLPPTPIAAPGDYALEAAMAPEDTPFMYYVLSAPGVHTFVVTDAEFQAAKRQCKAAGLGCG